LTPAAPAAASTAGGDGGGRSAAPKGKGKGKKSVVPNDDKGCEDKEAAATTPSDQISAAALLSLATRAENDAGDIGTPLAPLLRQAAARIGALEKQVGELGHSLRGLHSLSARTLVGLGLHVGTDGETFDVYVEPQDDKSYMLKKGSEETQELHQKAAEPRRPVILNNSGTLGGGTEKSKEEMELSRKARLDRLEALQVEKKKEQEIGSVPSSKQKAHQAMFSTQVGPKKNLGQF
jgi:hypothetical protein